MKFARFEICMDYLLTSPQEGDRISYLCNATADAIEPLFSAIESSFLYLPINKVELVGQWNR